MYPHCDTFHTTIKTTPSVFVHPTRKVPRAFFRPSSFLPVIVRVMEFMDLSRTMYHSLFQFRNLLESGARCVYIIKSLSEGSERSTDRPAVVMILIRKHPPGDFNTFRILPPSLLPIPQSD
jgi:hypothetical protein